MMEFGEAVLFSKFLREHGTAAHRHRLVVMRQKKEHISEKIQKEEPGLWFKWLAYKAATLQERRK